MKPKSLNDPKRFETSLISQTTCADWMSCCPRRLKNSRSYEVKTLSILYCSKDIYFSFKRARVGIPLNFQLFKGDTCGVLWSCTVLRERCFLSRNERETEKKILSRHEVSNLRTSDSALRCSTTELQRLYGE